MQVFFALTFHKLKYTLTMNNITSKNEFNQMGKLFRRVIFFICFFIATYMCYDGIERYFSNPIATNLELIDPKSELFPQITICPQRISNNAYDQTVLKKCKFS